MITSNLNSENLHLNEEKGNIPHRVNDQTEINQNNAKLEHEQCIKWIYDGEKSYIRGYN